ncbi:hypothetical protein Ssi03_20650 [Sphaerisporangium siamense]|nr:hypothetical protein Ssi03_20650 [Sphaerisporangium siamense]
MRNPATMSQLIDLPPPAEKTAAARNALSEPNRTPRALPPHRENGINDQA